MTSDAPTVDYRTLLEEERSQLRSQLSELGFGDDDGPTYDPNFADLSQVTAERGEAEALGGQLQETLGQHHDSVVMQERLRELALEGPPEATFALGRMHAQQSVQQEAIESKVARVAAGADKKSLRAWLS